MAKTRYRKNQNKARKTRKTKTRNRRISRIKGGAAQVDIEALTKKIVTFIINNHDTFYPSGKFNMNSEKLEECVRLNLSANPEDLTNLQNLIDDKNDKSKDIIDILMNFKIQMNARAESEY